MTDARIAAFLDEFTPSYDNRRGDWERVSSASRAPIRWVARLGVVAAVAAVAVTALLAWPFHTRQGPILDRALAAIGDGPVLHTVLRGEWGGTLVDLKTGERSPVYGEDEFWYDTERGRVHSIERLGGAVQDEELYEPNKPPVELAALGREYRQALENGTAHVTGEGTIGAEPVVWVTIHSEMLPDVADGKNHEWAQQVAVSRRTFKPVALRETRDGRPGPGTGQRVLKLELLSEGDFTASPERSLNGMGFSRGRDAIPLGEAQTMLGRAPLWLGREYQGLPLAQAFRETTTMVRRSEVRITGAKAEAVIKCTKLRAAPRSASACFRALGLHPINVRPDGVFTSGPVVRSDRETDLVLFYGTVGDDPSTFRKDTVPLPDRPHVTITESTRPLQYQPGIGSYAPPPGSVFIAAGARAGAVTIDGVYATIEAADEDAILAAARALGKMPG